MAGRGSAPSISRLSLEQAGKQLLHGAAGGSGRGRTDAVDGRRTALARVLARRSVARVTPDRAGDHGGVLALWRRCVRHPYDHKTACSTAAFRSLPLADRRRRFWSRSKPGRRRVVAWSRAACRGRDQRNVDGSTASTLVFDQRPCPRGKVIATGAAARRLAVQLQEFLMLGAAVELIGLAAAALDVTLDYIKLRQQFGRPIGSFQVLQHRAVNAFIDIELNRSLAYRVIAAFDAGEHHPAMVSAAKARASRCGLGDHSRRAADAWCHRLYRGARHRSLLQTRHRALRAIRQRAPPFRALFRPDARKRGVSRVTDAVLA